MRLPQPLLDGVLIRRYKRFLADVRLEDGRELTVHCPNSGSMKACSEPGRPIRISDSKNPARKLRYTLEMIRMGRTRVGVNTANPNTAVADFIARGRIPELSGYPELRREVVYGKEGRSRIDILLSDSSGQREDCYVEIKNTTYKVGEHSAFPDAVTERGRKHLDELTWVVSSGRRGVMFYFVGRADCHRFRPADEVDPTYGKALRQAVRAGVELLAYGMRFTRERIVLLKRLPVDL